MNVLLYVWWRCNTDTLDKIEWFFLAKSFIDIGPETPINNCYPALSHQQALSPVNNDSCSCTEGTKGSYRQARLAAQAS